MARLTIMCAVVAAIFAAPGSAATLYSVAHNGSELTGPAAHDATVRFVGQREMVVEAGEAYGAAVRSGGTSCETLMDLSGDLVPFICYPRSRQHGIDDLGEVIWSEPDGALLVLIRPEQREQLMLSCFMSYPLPQRVDVSRWFAEAPIPGSLPVRRSERPVRGFVHDVLADVSTDTLMKHVELLSEYPDGTPRSRYLNREECIDEGAAYIVGCLERYGVVVDTQAFTRLGYTCEQGDTGDVVSYPMENIIGTLPGNGRLGGCYIIGAHYDAIAGGSFPGEVMWWCDNEAPGADDNATGVATVLEAARVLAGSGGTYPFDVRFALFTAEEVGLDGSRVYADSIAAAGDTVYAVLNVDMIAYKRNAAHTDTCHIVTNTGTRWFADWLSETTTGDYAGAFPDFDVERIDIALAYSDHASFWANGYDGLVVIEHYDPRDRNINYHTIEDRLDTVFASQLGSTARMCVGALARLIDPDATFNLAVFGSDFAFTPVYLSSDEPGVITIDLHAYGPEEDVDVTLDIWDGEPNEGTLLESTSFTRTMGGGQYTTHQFLWQLSEDDVGEHDLWVRASTDGTDELTLTDNVASTTVHVSSPRLFVNEHFVWPNPASGVGDVRFRYELSRDAAAVELDIYDLTGQQLGELRRTYEQSAGDAGNAGMLSGWNDIGWNALGDGVGELASGVYIYRLSVWDRGAVEESDLVTGRFAVVR